MKQNRYAVMALFSIFMAFSSLTAAQEMIDTILVTDYWYRPGSFTWASAPSGGSSSGGTAEEAFVANEQARQQRCTKIRQALSDANCANTASNAPSTPEALNISTMFYGSSLLWEGHIMALANDVFNRTTQDFRVAASNAARASLIACSGLAYCQQEVLVYFGMNRVAIPNLGALVGDVSQAYNEFLRLIGAGRDLESSDAGKLIRKYYNSQFCNAVKSQATNAQNRCGVV